MAFTVSPDHARREQVWDAIQKSHNREAWQIRRMLTEAAVRASDKRARFVGIEAYETEGGVVLRDLFESDDFGWLPEPLRLDPAEDAATVTGFDPDSDADEGRNLPAFLSDDPDDEDRADGAGEAELLAAELRRVAGRPRSPRSPSSPIDARPIVSWIAGVLRSGA